MRRSADGPQRVRTDFRFDGSWCGPLSGSLSSIAPRIALLLAVSVLGACAGEPREPDGSGPPARVRLGPVFDLLEKRTGRDKVRLLVGKSERVHVFVAADALDQALELLVNSDGSV
ncbi:MAG: hypothetical protein ACYS0F_15905, partial [Planctomycetota bacterium]